MDNESRRNPIILVVEDVHETRDGIEKLLKVDGYQVVLARDELDGIESAQRQRPDLILVSLAGTPSDILSSGQRIRESATAGEEVPVVVFCFGEISAGAEVAIGKNVHIAQPDNFNQLRDLLSRLLRKDSNGHSNETKATSTIANNDESLTHQPVNSSFITR